MCKGVSVVLWVMLVVLHTRWKGLAGGLVGWLDGWMVGYGGCGGGSGGR